MAGIFYRVSEISDLEYHCILRVHEADHAPGETGSLVSQKLPAADSRRQTVHPNLTPAASFLYKQYTQNLFIHVVIVRTH